jgi:DNA-binding NtrC family response regulator
MTAGRRTDPDTGPESGATDTILVVDDEARIRRLLEMALVDGGYRVLPAGSVEEAEALLEKEAVDLVLSDLALPGRSGLDLLAHLRAQGSEVPVILITAFGTVESAVEAMKLGAFDYVIKPFRTEEIEALVARALQLRRAERENTYLRELTGASFEGITARSAAMAAVFRTIERVAPTPSTVLITGETGVGKELVARALHARSPRKDQLFVPLNCAAIPGELLEAELFGVTKGAFTGATQDRPGKFELAHGGTLFLDEIGDLLPETQVKLLRLLQEREYNPLGGVETQKADVRVVAATNRDLSQLLSQGGFRDDLYFRLAVVRLTIPPLKERRQDIPFLIDHFIQRFNARRGKRIQGVTPAVLEILMRHPLPGNVRELENVIEYCFVLCHNGFIDVQHLPDDLKPGDGSGVQSSEPAHQPPLERGEAEVIRRALLRNRGNRASTAEELGVSRTTLWRKLKRYGIRAEDYSNHTAKTE